MFWIYLTTIAYFLEAVVFAVDKTLLLAPIPNPLIYAFYASILSAFAVFLLPFGVHIPTVFNFGVAILSGLFFFIGLVYLYKSIKAIDILEATPAVGAITALTTFGANAVFLHEHFTAFQLAAFFLLVAGTLIMSYFHLKSRVVIHMLTAGIAFGFSFSTLKYFFSISNFVSGLFWSRMGLVASALLLLLFASTRRQIFGSFSSAKAGSKFLFVLNKVLSTVAFVILYYAIKIGSVVFVNALQGLQYVFILLMAIFLVKKMPRLFEKHVHEHFLRKVAAMILIVVGFFFLVF